MSDIPGHYSPFWVLLSWPNLVITSISHPSHQNNKNTTNSIVSTAPSTSVIHQHSIHSQHSNPSHAQTVHSPASNTTPLGSSSVVIGSVFVQWCHPTHSQQIKDCLLDKDIFHVHGKVVSRAWLINLAQAGILGHSQNPCTSSSPWFGVPTMTRDSFPSHESQALVRNEVYHPVAIKAIALNAECLAVFVQPIQDAPMAIPTQLPQDSTLFYQSFASCVSSVSRLVQIVHVSTFQIESAHPKHLLSQLGHVSPLDALEGKLPNFFDCWKLRNSEQEQIVNLTHHGRFMEGTLISTTSLKLNVEMKHVAILMKGWCLIITQIPDIQSHLYAQATETLSRHHPPLSSISSCLPKSDSFIQSETRKRTSLDMMQLNQDLKPEQRLAAMSLNTDSNLMGRDVRPTLHREPLVDSQSPARLPSHTQPTVLRHNAPQITHTYDSVFRKDKDVSKETHGPAYYSKSAEQHTREDLPYHVDAHKYRRLSLTESQMSFAYKEGPSMREASPSVNSHSSRFYRIESDHPTFEHRGTLEGKLIKGFGAESSDRRDAHMSAQFRGGAPGYQDKPGAYDPLPYPAQRPPPFTSRMEHPSGHYTQHRDYPLVDGIQRRRSHPTLRFLAPAPETDSSYLNRSHPPPSHYPIRPPYTSSHQRVCHDCGRSDTPEWRYGPNGPKTLCNACGLKYSRTLAKTRRKSVSHSSQSVSPTKSDPSPPILETQQTE